MQNETNSEVRDTLLLAGGIAFLAVGAGMILASPAIRRAILGLVPTGPALMKDPAAVGFAGLLPDVERYMKIRAM
jgi:hypothetical protein